MSTESTQLVPEHLLRRVLDNDQQQHLLAILSSAESYSGSTDSSFVSFYEEMRHNGHSRVCVRGSGANALPNSLASFQDDQVRDLALNLLSSFEGLLPAGLVFETSEGTYRAMEQWHGHICAHPKNLLLSTATSDDSFTFASAVRHGGIMQGSTVGVSRSGSTDSVSPLQCLSIAGGTRMFLVRPLDGFVVDAAKDTMDRVCWWYRHGRSNQQWTKIPLEAANTEHIDGEQSGAYILASTYQPRNQVFYLCLGEDNQLTVAADSARALRFAPCPENEGDMQPLLAYLEPEEPPVPLLLSSDVRSTAFKVFGDRPSSFFAGDLQQLAQFSNSRAFKPRPLRERESSIKAIPYNEIMETVASKYSVQFQLHPVCPLIGITVSDLSITENVHTPLPLSVLERLLFSARDFAAGLYDNVDISHTTHKERIGSSFSIVLDAVDNNCDSCIGRIPGLSALSRLDTVLKEVWGEVRGFVVLEPRVMYALLAMSDRGEEAAEEWKTRFTEEGNMLLF